MIDYLSMSPGEMHTELGADGVKWTDAMLQFNPNCGIERDVLFGWVCNMIMAGFDEASGGGPMNGDHAQFLIDREQAGLDRAHGDQSIA